jgi:ribose transport system substrate-binding protein
MVGILDEAIAAGEGWEPKAAEVPAVVVTKDSVEQFLKDHPEAIGQ